MSPIESYLRKQYSGYQTVDLLCIENELQITTVAGAIRLRAEVCDLLGVKKLPSDVVFTKEDFFLIVEILL